jgi:uncharacterized protein with PQ loop repeat
VEVFIYICAIVWVVGWISQIAKLSKSADRNQIDMPDGMMLFMAIFVFFTRPYWYFYGKA